MAMGGSWSVYWYNGAIVSSEIARGLDIFELTPSAFISQNEIDAAKTVHLDYLNAQGQPKFVWPASFALARAVRRPARALQRARCQPHFGRAPVAGERREQSGAPRRDALNALASQIDGDVNGSSDAARVRLLAGAVRDLAK